MHFEAHLQLLQQYGISTNNFFASLLSEFFLYEIYVLMFLLFKGDKLVRATELAKLLTLEKSMKGALTLVTRLKLPMLQEKFSSILEVTATPLNFFFLIELIYVQT